MKDDATNLEGPAAGSARKPYRQPRLVRFGRLAEITSAVVSPLGDNDSVPGNKTSAGG